jgi:hypothetical protein
MLDDRRSELHIFTPALNKECAWLVGSCLSSVNLRSLRL